MNNIDIAKTKYTPSLLFDVKAGLVEIRGDSLPENTFEFYKPLIDKLNWYFEGNHKERTVLNVEVTYFNSSTSKLFFDLFDIFEHASSFTEVEINWIYDIENENMEEAGEEFREDFEELNFNLVTK
jgi:hypothetical protein